MLQTPYSPLIGTGPQVPHDRHGWNYLNHSKYYVVGTVIILLICFGVNAVWKSSVPKAEDLKASGCSGLKNVPENITLCRLNSQLTDMVLIGDSITAKFQTDGRVYYDGNFRNLKPINLAVPGDTTEQTLARLNCGMLCQVKSSKVTTLMIGTNDFGRGDTPQSIVSQIGKIMDILQHELPGTHILLLGILPRKTLTKPGVINRLIAKYENGKNVTFLDMTDKFTDNGKMLLDFFVEDQLHLSSEGYRVFAESIAPIVHEILNEWSPVV